MARFARVVVPGCPHHVLQRGNRKENIFGDDSDRLVYLRLMRDACTTYLVSIWGYTLMDNHVHHVAVPEREDSLAKAVKVAHGGYSSYLNTKYGLVGHAWQGRFKSFPMEEEYCRNVMRYVELNPVRAGMVKRAEDYLWSSAAAHCDLRDDTLLSGQCPLTSEIKNWSEWLEVENEDGVDDRIRRHTRIGRPLGSTKFVGDVQALNGRQLFPKKRGPRPRQGTDGNNPEAPPTSFPLFG